MHLHPRSARWPAASAILFFSLQVHAGPPGNPPIPDPPPVANMLVGTAADEFNGNTVAANGPVSTGCSLREALQVISVQNNSSYPECTGLVVGGPNVIGLNGKTIVVGKDVPDPGLVPPATGNTHYDTLPDIPNVAGHGAVTIVGPGTIKCDTTNPTGIFREAADADFTLTALSAGSCNASGAGILVNNFGGDLTINTATISGFQSTGDGAVINHAQSTRGSLHINNVTFSLNIAGDIVAKTGNGGVLAIGTVTLPNVVQINNVLFTGNIAGDSGGAIYRPSRIDAFAMTNAIFTGNLAYGSGAEHGGGALFSQGNTNDLFLIINSNFLTNIAMHGQGGALLNAGGRLAYPNANLPLQLTGGVIASNFVGNQAQGDASGDTLEGTGGAIYSRGELSVTNSSFIGNASTHGSGGAIALRNPSSSTPPTVIANTTFNSNTADQNGGAISNLVNNGRLNLINDTISGNTAAGTAIDASAGGGALFNASGASDVNVINTILAHSDGAGGVGGNCEPNNQLTDGGNNLQFAPASGCKASMTALDPNLNPPSPLGGVIDPFLVTMSLGAGSAASGTGDAATCAGGPINLLDENFSPRPQGKPVCDIGAFESSIVPNLIIAKNHVGPFIQGDTAAGDTYTITVGNNGSDATSGIVTVTDTLPTGLIPTAFGGAGWTCDPLPALNCTRSDALLSGAYPVITLSVDVDAAATSPLVNMVSVAGGGESDTSDDMALDTTNIQTKTTPVTLQSFEVN